MNVKQLETNLERRWDSLSPTGRQKMIDMIEKEKGKKKGRGGTPLAKKKKDPEDAYSKPLKGAPKGHNLKLAKAKRKKAFKKSRTA